MHPTPVISVLIPAYNAERFLGDTIESIQSQTFSDWEMLIVDDGSQDATAEIAHRYAENDARIRVTQQSNAGGSHARATGFEASVGEFVYFIDADDIAQPDALMRLYQGMQHHTDAAVCFGTISIIDTAGNPIRRWYQPSSMYCGDVLRTLLRRCFIGTMGAAMIRRRYLEKVTLRNDLKIYQDVTLWTQIATLGPFYPIGMPPVLSYRQHGGNFTKQHSVNPDVYFEFIDLLFSHPLLTGKLSAGELRYYKRWRIFRSYRYVARQLLCREQFQEAAHYARQALGMRWYDPIAHVFHLFATLHYLPKWLGRELGKG